jgi:hypothetical protein
LIALIPWRLKKASKPKERVASEPGRQDLPASQGEGIFHKRPNGIIAHDLVDFLPGDSPALQSQMKLLKNLRADGGLSDPLPPLLH